MTEGPRRTPPMVLGTGPRLRPGQEPPRPAPAGPRPTPPATPGAAGSGAASGGGSGAPARQIRGQTRDQARDQAKGRTRDRSDAGPTVPVAAQDTPKGAPMLVAFFIASLLLPMQLRMGSLLLPPYRMTLLLLFIPLAIRLLSGKAGKMHAADHLMLGSGIWAVVALFVNHPFGEIIESAGLYMVEFYGAYLLGRVGVRSAEDFQRLARAMFVITLILLPFAAVESITRRPVLLDLIPNSLRAVDAGIRFNLRRAQTVFAHPIHYGAFTSICFGLAWYALDGRKSFLGRWPKAFVAALSTFFSLSTGALMAVMVQGVLILYEKIMAASPRRWTIFGWGAVAGYILLDMVTQKSPFHTIVHRMTFSTGSSYNRILIWQYGTENVANNPIFGLGLREWERPSWMSASADNFWLLTAMKFGLPSFIMFALALVLMIRWISRADLPDESSRLCRAGWLTAVGGIILAGGTVHYWGNIFSFIIMVFGAGAWMIAPPPGGAAATRKAPGEKPSRGDASRPAEPD